MAISVRLKRNLKKVILQGNPWIYSEALELRQATKDAGLCKVLEKDGSLIGWGLLDPNSPLMVRMLSLGSKPPTKETFSTRLESAWNLRAHLSTQDTNCFRLVNGEGDFLPGLICDIYNDLAVLQFDGAGPYSFWQQDWIAAWLLENTSCTRVYYKPRHDSKNKPLQWGKPEPENPPQKVMENGCHFEVDYVRGQKTGFFLDQRENRQYVRFLARNKSAINLFSYSGGFSIYAGVGGAQSVTSVDIAQEAIHLADRNWELNQLQTPHKGICADVFNYLTDSKDKYDIVICDPPSLAKAEKHKEQAIKKYTETFALAAQRVNKGGSLLLSSCSSHISFNDFKDITAAALSKARCRGQILRISGQGADHPFPHSCEHLRYLKFYHLVLGK